MKFSYLLFFLSLSFLVNAQSDTTKNETKPLLFINYEVYPKYKHGSYLDLTKDIYKKIDCPIIKASTKDTDLIILTFEIDKHGIVDCPKVIRGNSPTVEAQLLELIWDYEFEPGTFRGVPVKCQMNFPFRIKK